MSVRTMPRISKHTMLGRGGELRVPKSESKELHKIYNLIEDVLSENLSSSARRNLLEACKAIEGLREQVSEGYHRNPEKFKAGIVIGKIGKEVHDIRYKHAEDGKHYEHEFGKDVEVYAVERNGKRDLLLTHRNGEPLWDNF